MNSLLDNVHGFIGLTKVEDEIERLPVFKRLQDISQLGLTNRIFPCALHNRYVHSLGVMYIVDQMALRLNFDDDERQLIRLAGLLHDIGHYPFSHDVEQAYLDVNSAIRVDPHKILESYAVSTLQEISKLGLAPSNIEYLLNGTDKMYHHEKIGATVIKHSIKIQNIILDNFISNNKKFSLHKPEDVLNYIISDICAIITGDAQHDSCLFPDKFGAMVQLMHSELDADRIDYLLRDATFSGASYGNFDVSMLIQNLSCQHYGSINGKHSLIVGVKPKGICCAEQLLINRYFAYNQVIYHKYTLALGSALRSIVIWLLQTPATGFAYSEMKNMAECHETDNRFLRYTDAALISEIMKISPQTSPCPPIIESLVNSIRDFHALKMSDEVVFSGIDQNILKENLEKSPLYREVSCYDPKQINRVYHFKKMQLTKHLPRVNFEELINMSLKSGSIQLDMVPLFRIDRLQDGLAIVDDAPEPYLLIDSSRSMIHDIYNLSYCILRSYSF